LLAYCEEECYQILEKNTFHLIILDINLPDSTGFEICKDLRKKTNIPIIFASARSSVTDKVDALDLGGDFYLSKPYSMNEMLSAVNALIRRCYGNSKEEEIIEYDNIKINITSRTVEKNGSSVQLSLKEFDLLAYLAKNMNKAIEKDKLITGVWGTFSVVEQSTLTVHIRWLREKLEDDPANPKHIKTIHRVGYMLEK
jgi:DNA-binding response OmpR family regulator